MNSYCSCGSNQKIKARCTPATVVEIALSDDQPAVLVDANEIGILIGLTRSGSGVEFEYNRQETI
jgi:hypothetical protein